MESPLLSVSEALAGKRVLLTGSTGFLGKVTLSMLLHRYGEVLGGSASWCGAGSRHQRRGAASSTRSSAASRSSRCATSHGEPRPRPSSAKRCGVLDGDITDPLFGLRTRRLRTLTGQVDVVVNCAGLVSFNPSLEVGLNVNTYGVKNAVELCRGWDVPLVHMSTAFVAGNRSGAGLRGRGDRRLLPHARASWTGATSRSSRS